jgi:hypothetical protein
MKTAIVLTITLLTFVAGTWYELGINRERQHGEARYPVYSKIKLTKMFKDAGRMSRLHRLCDGKWKVSHKHLCAADAVRGR